MPYLTAYLESGKRLKLGSKQKPSTSPKPTKILGFHNPIPQSLGQFTINLPAALEDDIIAKLNPAWNGVRESTSTQQSNDTPVLQQEVTKTLHTPTIVEKTVNIIQEKTKASVPIPITKGMSKILGDPITWPKPPTNQEFNRHVKVLCKMVGLSDTHEREGIPIPLHDLITSHIGRRSFATNNYSKMPLVDLAVFTGHKTIGELENYIKVSELEVLSQHASKLK